ncbi:MAG: hypothetical protein GY713_04340 [Actinomycetia bacterium]|nr:hypothetical protein [Actinomycetes bacterium]
MPTTTTTALATTTTTDDGEQTIAEREAELIELIAAGATGPEEWVLVAARALAAEQLVLERPGEVNLLDYFTEDSPYLEETVRPARDDFIPNDRNFDGNLTTLQGVEVVATAPDGTTTLTAVVVNQGFRILDKADQPVYETTGGETVSFLMIFSQGADQQYRMADRGLEKLIE